jgi:hypothetical protein
MCFCGDDANRNKEGGRGGGGEGTHGAAAAAVKHSTLAHVCQWQVQRLHRIVPQQHVAARAAANVSHACCGVSSNAQGALRCTRPTCAHVLRV